MQKPDSQYIRDSLYIFLFIILAIFGYFGGSQLYNYIKDKDLIETKQVAQYINTQRIVTLSKYYSDQAEHLWGASAGVASIRIIEEIDEILADTSIDLHSSLTTKKVLGVITVESGFNVRIKSHAGAIGLMQVMPGTAKMHDPTATPYKLTKRKYNLRIGILELSRLLYVFDGDMDLALLAYNRGEWRVKSLLNADKNPDNGYANKVYNSTLTNYEYASLIVFNF